MKVAEKSNYPPDDACAADVLRLAGSYHEAAAILYKSVSRGRLTNWYPFRLISNHAIELYLTAYLVHYGMPIPEVRSFGHNLRCRVDTAQRFNLALRKNRLSNLYKLADTREYIRVRYDAAAPIDVAHNAVMATLADLKSKITVAIEDHQPDVST